MHLGESFHTHLWDYSMYIGVEFIHHDLYTQNAQFMHTFSIPTVVFFNYKIESHSMETCELLNQRRRTQYVE